MKIEASPYYPETVIKLELPANCLPGEAQYYEQMLEGNVRACQVLQFANVLANRELVLWKEGKMIPKAFAWPWLIDKLYGSYKEKLKLIIKNRLLRKTSRVEEVVLWCLDGYSTGGYYHWITEILPRLWMAKNHISDSKFAIPDYFFAKWAFCKEFFDLLEVKNFLIIKNERKYRIRNLIMPTRAGNPFFRQHVPLSEGVKWLQHAALQKSDQSLGDRIYISRQRANYRKVINELDIQPVLEKFGFKIVCFEDYSLTDQISMCSKAKVLMGLHGAGLSNLVFLPENSKVIEIRPAKVYEMYNCFFTLSYHFKCKYNYILCDYSETRLPTEKRIDDHSVILSAEVLEKSLRRILGAE